MAEYKVNGYLRSDKMYTHGGSLSDCISFIVNNIFSQCQKYEEPILLYHVYKTHKSKINPTHWTHKYGFVVKHSALNTIIEIRDEEKGECEFIVIDKVVFERIQLDLIVQLSNTIYNMIKNKHLTGMEVSLMQTFEDDGRGYWHDV